MNKEKFGVGIDENDSVIGSAVDSMAESVKNLLHGIRNSVRGLIRNLAFATQLSAAAWGVIDCGTSPAPEGLDHPAQCVSKNPSPEPDDTPQCDSTIPAEPQVKEVAVCFMRWSDSYDLTEEIRAKLNAEFDLATRFFTEATFGRDLYEFNLIDSGTVWAGPFPENMDDDIDFAIQACAPQIDDFNEVDTLVVFPSFDDSQALGNRKTVHTPDGDIEMGVISLPHYTKRSDTLWPELRNLRHEIGHADFLLSHATEYICNDGDQLLTYSPDPKKCHVIDYGNIYDLMGGGLTLPDSNDIFGHPGGFEKSLNGLVETTTITENSGTYPLAAIEIPCSNLPQVIRIPYSKFPLCLEYRKPVGFDADYSEDNINSKLGYKGGLPPDGCVFLQICSNDISTLGYGYLQSSFHGSSFLLKPIPVNNNACPSKYCLPREGFCDANLGIDVSYSQSTTNPNAVIVNVSGVDETRLAKSPNLKVDPLKSSLLPPNYVSKLPDNVIVANVSETGESVGTFNIKILGKRISDGQYEVIETRTIDGLLLFGKATINFPPDQLASLVLKFSHLKFIVDPENVIDETDETDNEATYSF